MYPESLSIMVSATVRAWFSFFGPATGSVMLPFVILGLHNLLVHFHLLPACEQDQTKKPPTPQSNPPESPIPPPKDIDRENTFLLLQITHLATANTALENNILYLQDISARNAREATLASNALRSAEVRIAHLEAEREKYQEVAHMRDQLTADALGELARVRGDVEMLVQVLCEQALELARADVEGDALWGEIEGRGRELARVRRGLAVREGWMDALRGGLEGVGMADDRGEEENGLYSAL